MYRSLSSPIRCMIIQSVSYSCAIRSMVSSVFVSFCYWLFLLSCSSIRSFCSSHPWVALSQIWKASSNCQSKLCSKFHPGRASQYSIVISIPGLNYLLIETIWYTLISQRIWGSCLQVWQDADRSGKLSPVLTLVAFGHFCWIFPLVIAVLLQIVG